MLFLLLCTANALFLRETRLQLYNNEYVYVVMGNPGRFVKLLVTFSADVSLLYAKPRTSTHHMFDEYEGNEIFYFDRYKLRLPFVLENSAKQKRFSSVFETTFSESSSAYYLENIFSVNDNNEKRYDGQLALGPHSTIWKYWQNVTITADGIVFGTLDTFSFGAQKAAKAPIVFRNPDLGRNDVSYSSKWHRVPRGAPVVYVTIDSQPYFMAFDFDSAETYFPAFLQQQKELQMQFDNCCSSSLAPNSSASSRHHLDKRSADFDFHKSFSSQNETLQFRMPNLASVKNFAHWYKYSLARKMFANASLAQQSVRVNFAAKNSPLDNMIVLGKNSLCHFTVFADWKERLLFVAPSYHFASVPTISYELAFVATALLCTLWLLGEQDTRATVVLQTAALLVGTLSLSATLYGYYIVPSILHMARSEFTYVFVALLLSHAFLFCFVVLLQLVAYGTYFFHQRKMASENLLLLAIWFTVVQNHQSPSEIGLLFFVSTLLILNTLFLQLRTVLVGGKIFDIFLLLYAWFYYRYNAVPFVVALWGEHNSFVYILAVIVVVAVLFLPGTYMYGLFYQHHRKIL